MFVVYEIHIMFCHFYMGSINNEHTHGLLYNETLLYIFIGITILLYYHKCAVYIDI